MSGFSRGKWAVAICDRCSFKFPYGDLKAEPGTGWRVCAQCNDGLFSLVSHPQNMLKPIPIDPEALEFPRPEVSVGA
jgi:hypothetical protein